MLLLSFELRGDGIIALSDDCVVLCLTLTKETLSCRCVLDLQLPDGERMRPLRLCNLQGVRSTLEDTGREA